MSSYQIIEVTNDKTRKRFIEFPVELYKNEKNWIRPLDQDVESVFDLKKNKFFRNGEAIRWILIDTSNAIVGR